MTEEDARALRPGMTVETKIGYKRCLAEVLMIETFSPSSYRFNVRLTLRPNGVTADGMRRGSIRRWPDEVLRVDLDVVTANCFADWLDERGEHRAAFKLREAFPLVRADGTTGSV